MSLIVLYKMGRSHKPWSSLVERDEGSHQPNCQTNFVIIQSSMYCLDCFGILSMQQLASWIDTSLHLRVLKGSMLLFNPSILTEEGLKYSSGIKP